MRPHRRRHPLAHVLIAGLISDAPAIQRLLLALPRDCYGQVFVEAGPDADLRWLQTPERVMVSRLLPAGPAPRSEASFTDAIDGAATHVITTRGAALAQAVSHWLAEWMPEDCQPDREFAIWVGAGQCEAVEALCAADSRIERI